MISLRSVETLHYSLVFVPEADQFGRWVQAVGDTVVCGPDDPTRTANEVLRSLPAIKRYESPRPDKIYLIGFQKKPDKARAVSEIGFTGVAPDDMPGSIFYDLIGQGEFAGSLIHTPNIYDFPVSLQICRILGGDSIWVHNGEKVNFSELWLDERADMLRLPGIVATSPYPDVLAKLAKLAKDWNPIRYRDV